MVSPLIPSQTPGYTHEMLKPREGSATNETGRVEDWIEHDSRAWREDVVRSEVDLVDSEVVLNVPISLEHRTDMLKWPHTRDRSVSVRSAYYSIKESRNVHEPTDAQMTVAGTSNL